MDVYGWAVLSNVGSLGRSFLPIERRDLKKLLQIAKRDRETFFMVHPEWAKFYAKRVLCVVLCQGAAQHYDDGITGINDFDVYTFYKKHPLKNWYAKRIKCYDFGNPKFGKSVDKPGFIGRRVDCLSRAIDVNRMEDAVSALRRYLTERKTETAKLLSAKAVVLLVPNCGRIILRPGGIDE